MNEDKPMDTVSRSTSRTCGTTVSGLALTPLTENRLQDIARQCKVPFEPLASEPLEAQRERFVRLLEERISMMLACLLELDTGLHEAEAAP